MRTIHIDPHGPRAALPGFPDRLPLARLQALRADRTATRASTPAAARRRRRSRCRACATSRHEPMATTPLRQRVAGGDLRRPGARAPRRRDAATPASSPARPWPSPATGSPPSARRTSSRAPIPPPTRDRLPARRAHARPRRLAHARASSAARASDEQEMRAAGLDYMEIARARRRHPRVGARSPHAQRGRARRTRAARASAASRPSAPPPSR